MSSALKGLDGACVGPSMGSDGGPGSTVLDELLSHEQNFVHMNWQDKICIPAAEQA